MLGLCDSRDQTQGLRDARQSHYKLAMLPAQHVCFQTKANLLNKCHIRLTPKAFNNSLILKPSPYSSSLTPHQCVAKANMLLFPFHLPCSISILPDTSFRLSTPSGLVSVSSQCPCQFIHACIYYRGAREGGDQFYLNMSGQLMQLVRHEQT